jgi:hypothetical protein
MQRFWALCAKLGTDPIPCGDQQIDGAALCNLVDQRNNHHDSVMAEIPALVFSGSRAAGRGEERTASIANEAVRKLRPSYIPTVHGCQHSPGNPQPPTGSRR